MLSPPKLTLEPKNFAVRYLSALKALKALRSRPAVIMAVPSPLDDETGAPGPEWIAELYRELSGHARLVGLPSIVDASKAVSRAELANVIGQTIVNGAY